MLYRWNLNMSGKKKQVFLNASRKHNLCQHQNHESLRKKLLLEKKKDTL